MFTGLVETIGTVSELASSPTGTTLTIADCDAILWDVHLGDSIAVDGTCLTVTEFTAPSPSTAGQRGSFKVGLAPETLRRTNLSALKQGSKVNLERAVAASAYEATAADAPSTSGGGGVGGLANPLRLTHTPGSTQPSTPAVEKPLPPPPPADDAPAAADQPAAEPLLTLTPHPADPSQGSTAKPPPSSSPSAGKLERNTRMGGHFVQGHVDTVATVVRRQADGEALVLRFAPRDPAVLRYVVEKGYVTVDGASLTVTAVGDPVVGGKGEGEGDDKGWWEVMLVAYTQAKIVTAAKELGDMVNVEVDMVGKYVEKSVKAYFAESEAKQKGEGSGDGNMAVLEKMVGRIVEEKLKAMK